MEVVQHLDQKERAGEEEPLDALPLGRGRQHAEIPRSGEEPVEPDAEQHAGRVRGPPDRPRRARPDRERGAPPQGGGILGQVDALAGPARSPRQSRERRKSRRSTNTTGRSACSRSIRPTTIMLSDDAVAITLAACGAVPRRHTLTVRA